jgi:hypothetical protein
MFVGAVKKYAGSPSAADADMAIGPSRSYMGTSYRETVISISSYRPIRPIG